MKKLVSILALVPLLYSCEKEAEPVEPVVRGIHLVYTNMKQESFDQIKVALGKDSVGALTAPFLVTLPNPTPPCEATTSNAVLRLEKPEGKYKLSAKAFKDGKQVTSWSTTIEINYGTCGKTKLNSSK